MFSRFLTLFLSFCLLTSTSSFAATPKTTQPPKKPKLVLMPVSVSDEDAKLQGAMENALAEGLQEKYTVFSGDAVKKKGREIFEKENKTAKGKCDETKCMEDIALAFNSELLATASVTKQENDYFLSINIQNIFDNKVIYTKSLSYENYTAAQVINKFKELAGVQTTANNTSAIASTTIEQKLPSQKNTDTETTVWEEAQKGNTVDDYQVYLDTYPKGKYMVFAKARLKKLTDAQQAIAQQEEQTVWDTAQEQNTHDSYESYLASYPNGKFAGFAKVRIKKFKTEEVVAEQPKYQVPKKAAPTMVESTLGTLVKQNSQTPKKPRVVLMPIKVSEEDRNLAGAMETALVEGLQGRYTVFSGERVQQKAREIFNQCDGIKCMEDMALAFQAELIAVTNITKRQDRYFLSISIQNIFDNQVVYSKAFPFETNDHDKMIKTLKNLGQI